MKSYENHTKNLYNNINEVWPDNSWYNYTHKVILTFLYKHKDLFKNNSITINAGSGGAEYDLCGTMYHIDIAENLLVNLPNSVVASIEAIPYENDKFDNAICVGSVINYCNALTALSELSRVLKQKSIIILEYERSQTGELLLSRGYNKSSTFQQYTYNNQSEHRLWLYSDKYIDNILIEFGFKTIDCIYYHTLSAIANRFFKNEAFTGRLSRADKVFPTIFKKKAAHNRILLCIRD